MSKERWKLTDEEYEFIKGEVAHVLLRYQIRCVPVSTNDAGKFKVVSDKDKYKSDGHETAKVFFARRKKK